MKGEIDKKYLELALIADTELEAGDRTRMTCLWCGGGTNKEKDTLSLTKNEDGSIYWKCFRASCEASGRRNATGLVVSPSRRDKTAPRPYTGFLDNLNVIQKTYLKETYDLTFLDGVKYAPKDSRYSFAIFSPLHEERGTVLRSLAGATPKTLNYREVTDEPFIGWYFDPTIYDGGPTVLVEDCLSALKVAQCGGAGVVLNGVHVSHEAAGEIGKYSRDKVIIALDNGTLKRMLTIKEKYDIILKYPKIWMLDLDLKYVDLEEIKEGLFDGRTNFRTEDIGGRYSGPRRIHEVEQDSGAGF